ncbi:MAG TPA: hypothetical protein VF543_02880 [Pyrinomonadaceae bacterium]|jgi:hypothetical protein
MSTRKDIAPLLFHDADKPLSLGCINCPEQGICGGLRTSGSHFDCLAFCECDDPSDCQYVCPNNLENYIARFHEVQGFEFNNVPRAPVLPYQPFPFSVPLLYHSSGRLGRFVTDTVAIPLTYLLDRKTGMLRYSTREELTESFGFDDRARLIIMGVDQDQPIEDYWSFRRATHIPEQLARLKPDLVTAPNYSVFLDSPRWDNLHNMKRIAICWSELVAAGIPTSLHLNARTDRDWERWTEFVVERDEIRSVAFEYATGAARQDRGEWHTEKLAALALAVPRDLQIVVRGGYAHLEKLYSAFHEVVFIDTTSFMKTINRQKLTRLPSGKLEWRREVMPNAHPLDDLLEHNVRGFSRMISDKVSEYLKF